MFKEQRQQVSSLIRKSRATYYNNKVTECACDQKALFRIVDKLLHRTDIGALPSGDSNAQIASRMSDFFSEKIDKIWNSLPTDQADVYAHSDPIFKRLHFLKVDDLFTLQQLKLYYNYSHNDVPIYFQNWTLIPNCNVHKHDTRNKHELYTYRVKHEYAKKCLRHNLPLILNNISHLVKEKINTHSMLGFVKYVKHHLLQSYHETCTISNCYTCMHNC